ncbi:MAG: hypothetical protein HRT44_13160, partial [Bdellovibrionales bacterium]|nr:hypothetical protein [Bdellovibrionales bacterium]NQZ20187.1 hypothetical protein [Bdellovibrionales bacterium]
IDSVITMGMPEVRDAQQFYRRNSLESYERDVRMINLENFDTMQFPYFDPGVNWRQAPFMHGYNREGTPYYWNGKFSRLNEQGLPLGEVRFRDQIREFENALELNNMLTARITLAVTYREIAIASLAHRRSFNEDIIDILDSHGLLSANQ